jgi:hypothetical protein
LAPEITTVSNPKINPASAATTDQRSSLFLFITVCLMKKITKADLIYAYLFSIKYFVPNSITTMNFVASHTCTA